MSELRQQGSINSGVSEPAGPVFRQENLWYFKTREGEKVGPFRYRSEAESNLSQLMERIEEQLKQS